MENVKIGLTDDNFQSIPRSFGAIRHRNKVEFYCYCWVLKRFTFPVRALAKQRKLRDA